MPAVSTLSRSASYTRGPAAYADDTRQENKVTDVDSDNTGGRRRLPTITTERSKTLGLPAPRLEEAARALQASGSYRCRQGDSSRGWPSTAFVA